MPTRSRVVVQWAVLIACVIGGCVCMFGASWLITSTYTMAKANEELNNKQAIALRNHDIILKRIDKLTGEAIADRESQTKALENLYQVTLKIDNLTAQFLRYVTDHNVIDKARTAELVSNQRAILEVVSRLQVTCAKPK